MRRGGAYLCLLVISLKSPLASNAATVDFPVQLGAVRDNDGLGLSVPKSSVEVMSPSPEPSVLRSEPSVVATDFKHEISKADHQYIHNLAKYNALSACFWRLTAKLTEGLGIFATVGTSVMASLGFYYNYSHDVCKDPSGQSAYTTSSFAFSLAAFGSQLLTLFASNMQSKRERTLLYLEVAARSTHPIETFRRLEKEDPESKGNKNKRKKAKKARKTRRTEASKTIHHSPSYEKSTSRKSRSRKEAVQNSVDVVLEGAEKIQKRKNFENESGAPKTMPNVPFASHLDALIRLVARIPGAELEPDSVDIPLHAVEVLEPTRAADPSMNSPNTMEEGEKKKGYIVSQAPSPRKKGSQSGVSYSTSEKVVPPENAVIIWETNPLDHPYALEANDSDPHLTGLQAIVLHNPSVALSDQKEDIHAKHAPALLKPFTRTPLEEEIDEKEESTDDQSEDFTIEEDSENEDELAAAEEGTPSNKKQLPASPKKEVGHSGNKARTGCTALTNSRACTTMNCPPF